MPSMSLEKEKIYQCIVSQINDIECYSLDFIFSSKRRPYLDTESIAAGFEKDWHTVKPLLEQEGLRQSLAGVLFPKKPYDQKIIQHINDISRSSPPPQPFILIDICIAKILKDALGKSRSRVTPQLLLEILNLNKLRTPEFLIVIKPIIKIILDQEKSLSHAIKSCACEVLINNYESEALFTFISCAQDLKEEEQQVLFQSLTAFQKIYRKFLELHVGIPEKDLIGLRWFGVSFNEIRQKREFRDSFSNLVKRFIVCLMKRNKTEAIPIGRYLVLRFNNEDILRVIRHEISKNPALSLENPFTKFIYRQIYKIMQEFRQHYISQEVDREVTQVLSETEAQAINTMQLVTVGKVPANLVLKGLPKGSRPFSHYPLLPEFMETLDKFNLKALYELHSIPLLSQQVFALLAYIADNVELDRDELFHLIFYMENVLFFLQELEEMGITIKKDSAYGLIKNPYQLDSLNLIKEGTYFASTGLWYQSTIPPSVIRCIIPHAIPNCVGIRDRHIFSCISLVTGGFRGSPFDLDSTHRYDWDEEPEKCLFRPGYFQITIPQPIQERWEETQSIQKSALEELIKTKQWN